MNRAVWLLVLIVNASILALLVTPNINLDYKAFYATGRTVLVDPHLIYDQQELFRNSGLWKSVYDSLPNCHLPHEALLWAPLAKLPFLQSFRLWQGISFCLLIPIAFMLARLARESAWSVFLMTCAAFPVAYSIASGQDSILLLLLLLGSLQLLLKDKPILAGLVLSLALFKPQVPLVIVVALLASRRYRAFTGFAIGSGALLIFTLTVFGNWIPGLISMTHQAEPFETATKMVSVRGAIGLFAPSLIVPLSLVVGLALIVNRLPSWRRSASIEQVFCSAILVGGIVAFHFHVQDTAIFLIPLAVLYQRGLTVYEKWAAIPFFCAPFVLFLMSLPATCMLLASVLVWLRSFVKLNTPALDAESLTRSEKLEKAFPMTRTPTVQTRC